MNLKRIIGLILVITGSHSWGAKALGGEGQSGDLDHPAPPMLRAGFP